MPVNRILLINPRVDYRPQPPLGLAYIAGALEEKGYEVRIYDPVKGHNEDAFAALVAQFQPDVAGITCLTPQEGRLYYFADAVKRIRPQTLVLAGGVHPTICLLYTSDAADE